MSRSKHSHTGRDREEKPARAPASKLQAESGFRDSAGGRLSHGLSGAAPLAANPGKERRVNADQCSRTPQSFAKFLFRGVSVGHPLI